MLHKNLFLALAAALSTVSAQAQNARLQVIHNCPDAAADSVDVYVNGARVLDNFAFRTATPFINAPAGTVSLAVAPKTSTSVSDAIYTATPTLTAGATYVVVAEGIVSATGYSPAPAFRLSVYGMGRETAATSGNTDVLVAHGSTDAPTVDVRSGSNVLVNDIAFGQFSSGYLSLPTADYTLSVTSADGATTVASYRAPLQTLGLRDSAITVLASGFVNRAANSNGPAFGLYAALRNGGALVALPLAPTSVPRPAAFADASIYPNPATNRLYLRGAEQAKEVLILDMSGKVVLRAQAAASIDIATLSPGNYTVSLIGDAGTVSMPFTRS